MKTARILAAILAGLMLATNQLNAESTRTQLLAANIEEQNLMFRITAEKQDSEVRFQVWISSKRAMLSTFTETHLAVFDGTNQIVVCPIEKKNTDKSVHCEFKVNTKYLAQSKFTFVNMAESNGRPMPAGDFYWFYLKDFALTKRQSNLPQQNSYILQALVDTTDNGKQTDSTNPKQSFRPETNWKSTASQASLTNTFSLWHDLQAAAAPKIDDLKQTQFALIGEIAVPEGTFHVVIQRLVMTGMLSPRGQSKLLLFDAKRELVKEFVLNSANPLWCEGARIYLAGNGLIWGIDPKFESKSEEDAASGGNVVDFSRGLGEPFITREQKYGSSDTHGQ